MKKTVSILAAAVLLLGVLGALGGCGKQDEKTLVVGASITPHAEILEVAKPLLEKEGYKLNIVEYSDYIQPNKACESGELDANYFQHKPYMENFNEETNSHLVSVAAIHYEPFGVYAGKTASLADLSDGAVIAIPNDGTNEARALYLLEKLGLIKLREGVGFTATVMDIAENPKKLDIKELEAAQLVRALDSADIAVINGNYAIGGGLKVADALALEESTDEAAATYANIVAVKEGNENSAKIQALVKALQSEEVKAYIEQ
ncbi:MAG: metal ABC transporter substrate-binding protein, partial [Clostridiales bacterium]